MAKATKAQIERRLETLREWQASGVPEGVSTPASLNQVRRWDDASLGITPIGSPSSFTLSHKRYGALVQEIDTLLLVLNRPVAKRRTTGQTAEIASLKARIDLYHEVIGRTANEMTGLSADLEQAQRDCLIAERRADATERDLAAVEQQLRQATKRGRVLQLRAQRPGGGVADDD